MLFGVYCPLNSNSQRNKFRQLWIETLNRHIRNLRKIKRIIIIMGDINVLRDKIDTSYNIDESQDEIEGSEDSCQRTWLNKLLLPHLEGFMIDLCRHFRLNRKEMFTLYAIYNIYIRLLTFKAGIQKSMLEPAISVYKKNNI